MKSFDDTLKLSKITLFLSGINLNHTKWHSFTTAIFYFNLLWLYVDVIAEFNWLIEGIQTGKNFGELSFITPCITISLLATAKTMPLFLNRHLLFETVNKLRDIHPVISVDDNDNNFNDDSDAIQATDVTQDDFNEVTNKGNNSVESEKKIVQDSLKFLNIVMQFLLFACSAVVILFTLLPVMSMTYHYYNNKEVELKLIFLTKYFFDAFTMKTWPFMYFHQVWSTYIAAFNVFGADSLHYTLSSFIQMHFQMLCLNFEKMDLQSRNPRDVLIPLVKRHQELIGLVNDMEVLYTKSTFFNIITSSVLICLSAFNVTVLDDHTEVCAFLSFLIMSTTQISLLCLFGDILMSSSIKVSEAIYKCRWYDADRSTKRSLFLIILRGQKPCKLTAAKFGDLNLSAFTTILSRSWSLFALLQTMYHK